MSHITIYHNPACGTSRNTLEMIRNSGTEPEIILYLETPPSRDTLTALIAEMGISVRDLLRKNVEPYEQLGLAEDNFTDDQLIDFMLQHPILINRPIVVTPLGTRLCRPSEVVLDILPDAQKGAFTKEDGEAVVDASGKNRTQVKLAGRVLPKDSPRPQFSPPSPGSLRVNGARSVT
jgi:arsenate reductase